MSAFNRLSGRSPKLLIYTDSAGVGGAEISLAHLVGTIAAEFEVSVVGIDAAVVDRIAHSRPQAQRIVLPAKANFLTHWFTFRRLQPDIIHLNLCTPWAGAIGLAAALMVPGARVVRVDQLPLRTTDAVTLWRTRFLSLRVDAHVAVGKASAGRMEDFYALGRDTVISIPNGVPDLGEPDPLPERPPGEMVVGSVGRLDAMKGHDLLLRAIALVPGVHLVILGEGAERGNLEKLAWELGICNRLELPGWQDHPRKSLSQFDVVALPSRSEGFPLAMVEAMLAGRPVIATRVGSMPEAVIDGETGILIEKNDVTALAQALQRLRDDPGLRCQIGVQARQLAVAQLTVKAMTQSYEALWLKLLTAPRKPRLRVPRPRD